MIVNILGWIGIGVLVLFGVYAVFRVASRAIFKSKKEFEGGEKYGKKKVKTEHR